MCPECCFLLQIQYHLGVKMPKIAGFYKNQAENVIPVGAMLTHDAALDAR